MSTSGNLGSLNIFLIYTHFLILTFVSVTRKFARGRVS